MQTFLPYPDFCKSALVLDYRRLGKQRTEAKQILSRLLAGSGGYYNHPATQMWKGYELALSKYGIVICTEWIRRGYRDNTRDWFIERYRELNDGVVKLPPWFGQRAFHLSHQSNLVRKKPEYYCKLFPNIPNNLPYVWPKNK